jgi:F-type H+-transporting ATPase subunit gamma
VLFVAITSNRGLCGGFNSNIIKEVKAKAANIDAATAVFTLGKKGNDILSKEHEIVGHNTAIFDSLNFTEAAALAQELMAGYAAEAYDEVHLVYNQFKNAATQTVTVEQFLPLVQQETANQTQVDYIYEPGQEEIFTTLLPKALKMQLFKALRDSFASEHGARMTAMHKATDNATDLRDQLKLTYNKARQAAITNEILEIVGGAEALNG